MSDSHLLDTLTLAQLRALEQRTPGFLTRVVRRYVLDLHVRLAAMDEACRRGELNALVELAHALKGDSRLLGAEPAARGAEQLEEAARARSQEGCAEAFAVLRALCERTSAVLRQLPEFG